jgi:hypothetical protein
VRRFRPIVLTAAAAVLAMIPLSRSVFWGPMAVAIMGGLIVATALTLLALPAMYAAWFRVARAAPPDPGAAWRRAGPVLRQAKMPGSLRSGAACGPAQRLFTARVAKLVDAPGLGPDAFTGVPVRVRPRAPASELSIALQRDIMAVQVETLEKLERRITSRWRPTPSMAKSSRA